MNPMQTIRAYIDDDLTEKASELLAVLCNKYPEDNLFKAIRRILRLRKIPMMQLKTMMPWRTCGMQLLLWCMDTWFSLSAELHTNFLPMMSVFSTCSIPQK